MVEQVEYKLARFLRRNSMNLPRDLAPKRVILIGAGAVKGAWDPLMKTLKENPPVKVPEGLEPQAYENKDFAPYILANNSFVYRAARKGLLKKATKNQDKLPAHFPELIECFDELRKNICVSYKEAQQNNLLSLRPEIEFLKTIYNPNDDGVITTNWDEVIWKRDRDFPNLVQLHGRVAFEKSLIFPTELTTDEEIFRNIDIDKICEAQKNVEIKEKIISLLKDKCIRGALMDEIEMAHDTAVHWLSSAEEVIVWGSGLNLYDAELNSIFAVSNNPEKPLKKLTVIDVCRSKLELAARICNFPIESVSFHLVGS